MLLRRTGQKKKGDMEPRQFLRAIRCIGAGGWLVFSRVESKRAGTVYCQESRGGDVSDSSTCDGVSAGSR